MCNTGLGCTGGAVGGTCEVCGGMGQACCGGGGGVGGTCNMGFVCAISMQGMGLSCQACGASMEPCCANRMCNTGLTCGGGGIGGTCM